MRAILQSLALTCFFSCIVHITFSQDRALSNFSFRVGAGSNIASQHFFTNDVAFNVPTTSFVHIGISTNFLERNNKSVFLGLEMEALNYYPAPTVKSNLGYLSLLAGKTRKYNINQWVYLKQTNGISLNTLAEVTASNGSANQEYLEYTGNPLNNLNIGGFSSLQVLFAGVTKKKRNLDYGLGLDVAYKGIQLYKNKKYPSYLSNNYFIQYGLNINVNYNF